GLRARATGGDAELALARSRICRAREAGGAGDARAVAVAHQVRAAADACRLGRVVVADHRPGIAARDPGVAGVLVGGAALAGGAGAAVADPVADQVGAAADAAHLVAAVAAGHAAGRPGADAVLADVRVA